MLGLDKSLDEMTKTQGEAKKGQGVYKCGKFLLKEMMELKGRRGERRLEGTVEVGVCVCGETKKEFKASGEIK